LASAWGSGALVILLEQRLKHIAMTHMLGSLLGGAVGLGAAKTIGAALYWADVNDHRVVFLHSLILLGLPYIGLVMGARNAEWLEPERIVSLFRNTGPRRRYRILDTSVIIDGRIADICETGFMDGTLVIPQFVLKELQFVADSSDSMKRNRGRRGLDILQKIQKMANVDVTISDVDFPDVKEVDLKLIELARTARRKDRDERLQLEQGGAASRRAVLNINELANSLKPVVLPGELMKVFILKEGKEYNQGRRVPRRRDDGRRGQRAQDDRQDHRCRRHQRAADDGGQDDLRPFHRLGDGGAGRSDISGPCAHCTRRGSGSARPSTDASVRRGRWQVTASV
jgi:uncharacterized protein YacL